MGTARVLPSDSLRGGEPSLIGDPPASRPSRHGRAHAQEVWQELAGPLSSAAMRLRSLRSQHAGGTRESRELDEIIREVDAAFSTVLRGSSPPPNGTGSDRPRMVSPPASAPRAVRDVAAGTAPP